MRKTARTGDDTAGPDHAWASASPRRPAPAGDPGRREAATTEPAIRRQRAADGPVSVPTTAGDDPPF